MGGQKNTKNVGHHLCMFPNMLGLVRLGLVRLGLFRLGLFRLGLVRLGLVRFS